MLLTKSRLLSDTTTILRVIGRKSLLNLSKLKHVSPITQCVLLMLLLQQRTRRLLTRGIICGSTISTRSATVSVLGVNISWVQSLGRC